MSNLLHEMGLVLGMTWLQLVNPVVDWGSGKLYVPNSVQTALLQGSWLEGHMHAGIVTVLPTEEELQSSKRNRIRPASVYSRHPHSGSGVIGRGRLIQKGEKNRKMG